LGSPVVPTSRSLAAEAVVRAIALALVWYALSDGAPTSWTIGAPVVVIATIASLALAPQRFPRLRLIALLAFVPFFIVQSVRGGADVVWRALRPAMPLAPGFTTFPLAAMAPAERIAFALIVSLLPGTLSARLEADELRVHVLDARMPIDQSLARLSHRLGLVFGRRPADDRDEVEGG
jgi:multicomponent Na+:H+ antiporter subunit E